MVKRIAVCGVVLAATAACIPPTYKTMSASAQAAYEAGDPKTALAALDDLDGARGVDDVLLAMDRAMFLHVDGQYAASSRELEKILRECAKRVNPNLADDLREGLYRCHPAEEDAAQLLLLINRLAAGDVDGGRVEALRVATRHDLHEAQRGRSYERLAAASYLSGVAFEMSGEPSEAFVSYWSAYELHTELGPLSAAMMRKAQQLRRPELEQLARRFPMPPPPGGAGEVVVVIEAGRAPEKIMREVSGAEDTQYLDFEPRPWADAPHRVSVRGVDTVPAQTLTSFEDIADAIRKRAGSWGDIYNQTPAMARTNLGIVCLAYLCPPLGMPMLFSRVITQGRLYEESWLSLPAEFRMARVTVPLGTHQVAVEQEGRVVAVRDVRVSAENPVAVVVVRTFDGPSSSQPRADAR